MGQAKLKKMAAELAMQHGGDVSAVENVLTQMTQPGGHLTFGFNMHIEGDYWVCRMTPKLTHDNEIARVALVYIEGNMETTKAFHGACKAIFDAFVRERFGELGTWQREQ